MLRTSTKVAAWACLVFIVYATLVPAELRPAAGDTDPDYERFAAYAVASLLMALAYPKRPVLSGVVIISFAVVLEMLQFVTLDRDPRISDAIVKIAGGISGTVFGVFWNRRTSDQPTGG